jgi:hypothetical protein
MEYFEEIQVQSILYSKIKKGYWELSFSFIHIAWIILMWN